MDRDKQLIDKLMERLSEEARDFVLTGMLYTLYIFMGLVAVFTLTGALKAWGIL